ncbi:MAG: hypothetical protein ACRC62_07975 [Microcoleus sp.]
MKIEKYEIVTYDPLTQTCSLSPLGSLQRGALSSVPISCRFGGSWEQQELRNGQLANGEQWGNAPRGARWGTAFPIEPGDIALVAFVEDWQSEPVIIGFMPAEGDRGPAWVANQVHSNKNDFTTETPASDDEIVGRGDILLPNGFWARALADSSMVVSTAPIDRPTTFMVLNADGSFKFKARNADQYNVSIEMDATTEAARVVVGGSAIEFKDGDIILRAKRNIRMFGQRVEGDVRPQKAGAMDQLLKLGADAALTAVGGPLAQAAGEMVLSGALNPVKASGTVVLKTDKKKGMFGALLGIPGIDAAVQGKISELLVEPQKLLDGAIEGFSGMVETSAIGQQLTGLLGAGALTGVVSDIQSKLDLTKLVDSTGIPSWIAKELQGQIPVLDDLVDIVTELTAMSDHQLLDTLLQKTGAYAMAGEFAAGAIGKLNEELDDLPSGLKTRCQDLLKEINTTPLLTPGDDLSIAAQRVGKLITEGETLLGGNADLFGSLLPQLSGLPNFSKILEIAGTIEGYFSNPHELLEDVPGVLAIAAEQIDGIPQELRELLKLLPPSELAKMPETIEGIFRTNADLEILDQLGEVYGEMNPAIEEFEKIREIIGRAPIEIQDALKLIPGEVWEGIAAVPAVLENPLQQLSADNVLLNTVFGATGIKGGAGLFDMRVSKIAQFNRRPKAPKPLDALNTSEEYHLQTESAPITRVVEYGAIEMPDYFSVD